MWGSRDPILQSWDPLISRERLKLETSNLARRWMAVSSNEKKFKIGSKGVVWGSRDPILKFWDPLISRERGHVGDTWPIFFLILGPPNISRTVKARNFKFGQVGSKGVMWGSRDPILVFWDSLISRERLKLETLNLARRWLAVSSNEKNSKLGQKGSCGGHVTQF